MGGRKILQQKFLRNTIEPWVHLILNHSRPKEPKLRCSLVQLMVVLKKCIKSSQLKDKSSSNKSKRPTNVLVFVKKVSSTFQSQFQMECLRRVAYKHLLINMDPTWV